MSSDPSNSHPQEWKTHSVFAAWYSRGDSDNFLLNLYHTVAPSSSSRAVSLCMHCISNTLIGKSVREKPQNTNVKLGFFPPFA